MALVDSGKPAGANVGDFISSLYLRLVVWVVVHSVHSVHSVTTILYRSTVGKVLLGGANYAHRAHFSPGGCTHERRNSIARGLADQAGCRGFESR